MRKRGFTLIELLVVVAIIALLIAILLPSLGRAKANAVRVKCAAVLKQWGSAINMYAQEQNDMFGVQWTNADASATGHAWTSQSTNSVTEIYDAEWASGGNGWKVSGGLHTCPGDPDFGRVLNYTGAQNNNYRPPVDYCMVKYYSAPGGSPPSGKNWMWKITTFTHPSTTMLMSDQSPNHSANTFSISNMGDYSVLNAPAQPFKDSLETRHYGTGNALFLDGHVDAEKYQDFVNNVPANNNDPTHVWTFQSLN